MVDEYKYLAFISYKREDEKWAKWLQRKLEHYKLPTQASSNTYDCQNGEILKQYL